MKTVILEERTHQVFRAGESPAKIVCEKASAAGSVSQRACAFCGARVVLYPITDALHLVHGPIGCSAYTWDIRGSLSSGSNLNRMAFSTDLRETDVIHGGEKKLAAALDELIERHEPAACFVYSTCIVGLIGDDVESVCRAAEARHKIPVVAVHCEGFKGSKKDGYKAAGDALLSLMDVGDSMRRAGIPGARAGGRPSINILGEFNLAGETWILKEYFREIGIDISAVMTGDARVADLYSANRADLNVVQCAGSMTRTAREMERLYGIPFVTVSFFGDADAADALYRVAGRFGDRPEILKRAESLVRDERSALEPELQRCRRDLEGKRAAVYVGGSFKAASLVKALLRLGVKTVLVGSQTGSAEDYRQLSQLCEPETVIVDDSNPVELSRLVRELCADVLIGGVKERPLAYKLGLGFCDHNHERTLPLAGFIGMRNFARELRATVMSPARRIAAWDGSGL